MVATLIDENSSEETFLGEYSDVILKYFTEYYWL